MNNPRSCFDRFAPCLLSVLRIVITILILQHGGQKLFGYPSPDTKGTIPPFSWPGGISGLIESICGGFLLLGLCTRLAAFILSGEMAVAYFMVHFPQAWWPIHNHGELAVIYCFVFLYLAAAGGGPFSLDAFICRRTPGLSGIAPPPGPGK